MPSATREREGVWGGCTERERRRIIRRRRRDGVLSRARHRRLRRLAGGARPPDRRRRPHPRRGRRRARPRSSPARPRRPRPPALIIALRMKGETVDELAGMVGAMLDAAAPLDPAGRHDRHRRHRRIAAPPGAGPQRVDDGQHRGGRRRRHGVQARQRQGVVDLRVASTCSMPSASATTSTPTAHRRGGARRRRRLLLRPGVPPRDAPRRPGPSRARRAHRVQRARPAVAPGPGHAARSSASATRGCSTSWPGCWRPAARTTRSSSTAPTTSTRSR